MNSLASFRSGDISRADAPGVMRQMSMTERLEEEKERLTLRLAEIDKALTVLKKQPEIQEVIDILAKTIY